MKKNLVLLFASSFISLSLFGNIGPQGFHQFKKRIFVETGSYDGNGIQKALEAGFSVIYSVDNDPNCVRHCQQRFVLRPNVHVFLKDSGTQLHEILDHLKEPVTFWLDAHNGFPNPKAVGVKNTPLMEELEQIKQHPIKTHTILIDDLHCCGTLYFDFLTQKDIITKIREINPDYTITYVTGGDSGEYPNNILVAYISSK